MMNKFMVKIIKFINSCIVKFDDFIYYTECKYNPSATMPQREKKWYTENLKPTQTNIFMGTVLGDLMKRINPDGSIDLYEDVLVSCREINNWLFILDGHHRWAASMLMAPSQKFIQGFPIFDYSFLYFMWEYIKQPIRSSLRECKLKYFKPISIELPDGIIELNCNGNDIPIDNATVEQFLDCLYTGKYMDPIVYKYDKDKIKSLIDFIGGEDIMVERFQTIKKEIKFVKRYRRSMLKHNIKNLIKLGK